MLVSAAGPYIVAAIILVIVLLAVVFSRSYRKPSEARASARSRRERRQRKSIRILRILVIGLFGLFLLLTAHLIIKNEESIFYLISHEIGFALLVSLVVWALFEAQLSHEAEATWDRRIERVTNNVFQAVLRKDLPKQLLDEANNLILNESLIRRSFTVTYTLSDSNFELELGNRIDCVLVEALMEFSMQNVSTDDVCWKVGLSLPNPVHADLKRLVSVRNLTVMKGGEAVVLDLNKARETFNAQLADNSKTAVLFHAGDVMLRPGETCDFSASYVMAKESEDSELLQTLYPADGLRVTLFDAAGISKRVTFARSVHRQALDKLPDDSSDVIGAKVFRVPGYLLPHQGVLIWWKRKPAGVGAARVPLAVPSLPPSEQEV